MFRAFTVQPAAVGLLVKAMLISLTSSHSIQIQFTAHASTGYLIEYRDSLSSGTWQTLAVLDPATLIRTVIFADPMSPGGSMRFYRVRTT